MKKVFLFVSVLVLTLSLNSCSNSDNGSSIGGTVTVTIDGQAKTFNTIDVHQQVFHEGTTDELTELSISALIGTSSTEIITFNLEKGNLGTEAIYDFRYKNGNFYYYGSYTNVTTNSTNRKLIGIFSGTASDSSEPPTSVVLSNGSFNIQY